MLAHVAASADAQLPPERFPFAPAEAAKHALKRAGIASVEEVDLWEINEAFSSVVLATVGALGLGGGGGGEGEGGRASRRAVIDSKVNVAGGAVA